MSNELTIYQEVHDFAKAMVASGYFTDVKQVSQAIVKIQAGSELGIPPFAAMSGIHIIKGKMQIGANLIASLIKNDPRYDFKVREISDDICTIEFFEDGESIGISSFSKADAERAGTQNMPKFPRNMLYARAMSNGGKWFVPGIFGGSPIYVEGELSPVQDDSYGVDIVTGEIVEPEPTPPTLLMETTFDDLPPHPKSKDAVVEEPEQAGYPVEELRSEIADTDSVKAGFVADRLAMTGLYNSRQHAINAMKLWPELGEKNLLFKTVLKTETAVSIFDWCVERKAEVTE